MTTQGNSSKKRSDSGWVQRAVLAGRDVDGKSLFFRKTVTFKGRRLGRIFGCHITYVADPAIYIHKNARPLRHMFLVENCHLRRLDQKDEVGLWWDRSGNQAAGLLTTPKKKPRYTFENTRFK